MEKMCAGVGVSGGAGAWLCEAAAEDVTEEEATSTL